MIPAATEADDEVLSAETLVVGVGNEMMRDDGVGVVAARALQGESLGEGVRVVELGARGLDLICEMEGVTRVIVIDAVKTGGEPGSIYRFTPEEARSVNSRTSSLHGIDLLDVLELAAVTKIRPQVVIVGVEPEEVAPGQSLSEAVRSRVAQVVEVVKDLIDDEASWSQMATGE